MNLSEIIPFAKHIKRDGCFLNVGLMSYKSPDTLGFIENERYMSSLTSNSAISCVVTNEEIAQRIPQNLGLILSAQPRKTFYAIHKWLLEETIFYGEDFPTIIDDTAHIHPTAVIASNNVKIGPGCNIGPNVTIEKNTTIEQNVIIRAGTVLGSEGFGFNKFDGEILHIPHAGGVLLNNNVEIHANCCIDKSLFGGFTEIGRDTKIDNLVYIAHNTKIGQRCLIAANATITGSSTIGNDVWIGPSVTIAHEIEIEDNASLSLGAVVTKRVKKDSRVTGNFAIDHNKFVNFIKTIR